ncbi:alpha/beta hydrolase [Gracilibacillus caseinilyticus]|uniref:Alpha/beta hydrolase n=1 Tax=Gracilibacillus caseinilyticus TaxID=2932256 RepID=A0ABY4EUZ6_9BACI|nr:alpha/beta hydrolase [Gracilibacillus caseinilyticus]UOQ48231.1 alpha/beta hydrolase [Gracilibacillus caseinilyticus]
MKDNRFWLETHDRQSLYVKSWQNNAEPKAVVQLTHGMAEHIERYYDFAAFLTDRSFIVYGHDHRGHGRTGENADSLGHIADHNGFASMVNDAITVTEAIKKKHPSLPVFLIGHSMGSFISRRYMTLRPELLDGVALIGTGFQSNALLHTAKLLAKMVCILRGKKTPGNLLHKLSFFGYNKYTENNSEFDWLCTDREIIDQYKQDHYCGFTLSNQFFYDLYDGLLSIQSTRQIKKPFSDLPLLLLSGKEDPVGNYGDSIKKAVTFYNSIGMVNMEWKLYKNGRHEILNETNKTEIFLEIATWIEKQMACHKDTQSV